ncbi:MAG: hypothetical protein Fur0032_16300 [Terrimicrobiaceae bacterium]
MAGSVAVMLTFAAQKEAVQAGILTDGGEAVVAASQHFMDVTLVAYVKDKTVFRRIEDSVEGDGEFNNPEVGAQVAARAGENLNEFPADFRREFGKLAGFELFNIGRRLDRF